MNMRRHRTSFITFYLMDFLKSNVFMYWNNLIGNNKLYTVFILNQASNMNFYKPLSVLISVLLISFLSFGQSIKNFYNHCNTFFPKDKISVNPPNVTFSSEETFHRKFYHLNCKEYNNLYNRPVNKIIIVTNASDTVEQIDIYLPFDTTLHKEMEKDLGASTLGWMAFNREEIKDTAHIIGNRFWFLEKVKIGFKCLRFNSWSGEKQEDFIIISILPKI